MNLLINICAILCALVGTRVLLILAVKLLFFVSFFLVLLPVKVRCFFLARLV
jgi:hypothetical protein